MLVLIFYLKKKKSKGDFSFYLKKIILVLKVKVKVKSLSRVQLFATPWTVAHQAPPSMGFSRQEYWSGVPFPSPGDLPDPRIEPRSPALEADAFPFPNRRRVNLQRCVEFNC